MKALANINRLQVRNETLMLLLDLYESKGKTFYYDDLFSKEIDAFTNNTLEKDVTELVKILKIDLTEARIKLCSKRDFVPKNKDEQLLLNVKRIVDRIQKSYNSFELITNEAQELSKMLGKDHTSINWTKNKIDEGGLLASNKFRLTREDLEQLIVQYKKLVKEKKYELTTLITNFYVDFINMKIFDNYNELIALMLLYTMLFQTFPIFKYVSFFHYFAKYQEPWQYALNQANYNWASQFSQTDNLTEIVYKILMDSYNEIDEIAHQYEFERNLNKSDNLENTILKFKRLFSKEDLREAHPTVSDSTINRTLQRLRDERKIMPIGSGRSSKWQVLVDQEKDFSQISIFDE
ncbi:hypothetical protein [Haploplasma axanthum]|uniref:Fido domain-containing protein n=1 Tax=Haploplasma axanthum TaxID=29552 RepID=A0A449BEK2_HAPAX|nr:hypothetical protein [Haploplasma axanthum]VEU80858.1 Uncharacterised protein [Haploplasma axanthum]